MGDFIEFMAYLSDFLKIEKPRLSFDTSDFTTDTQIGATDGETIFIRESAKTFDKFFSIAHEMRHIWQIKNGGFSDLSYNISDKTKAEYNNLEREIDANAFAAIVMVDMFGAKPQVICGFCFFIILLSRSRHESPRF